MSSSIPGLYPLSASSTSHSLLWQLTPSPDIDRCPLWGEKLPLFENHWHIVHAQYVIDIWWWLFWLDVKLLPIWSAGEVLNHFHSQEAASWGNWELLPGWDCQKGKPSQTKSCAFSLVITSSFCSQFVLGGPFKSTWVFCSTVVTHRDFL